MLLIISTKVLVCIKYCILCILSLPFLIGIKYFLLVYFRKLSIFSCPKLCNFFLDPLDKSNNTMANAVNGEVEEDGEEKKASEEDMEEGSPMVIYLTFCLLHFCNILALLRLVCTQVNSIKKFGKKLLTK